jgi:hypothetical protein
MTRARLYSRSSRGSARCECIRQARWCRSRYRTKSRPRVCTEDRCLLPLARARRSLPVITNTNCFSVHSVFLTVWECHFFEMNKSILRITKQVLHLRIDISYSSVRSERHSFYLTKCTVKLLKVE